MPRLNINGRARQPGADADTAPARRGGQKHRRPGVLPTIAVPAPALLIAIFAATGPRTRRLPIKHQSLGRA